MKKLIIHVLTACLILLPCLAVAAGLKAPQKEEITALNDLAGSKALLSHTGGKCWQTCADSDYGRLNCTTTCDEDGGSQPASGGGGINPFSSPENMLYFLGLCAVLGGLIYWISVQTAAAAA